MNREEFRDLFTSALDEAFKNAERLLGISLSDNVKIELYGAGHSGDIVDLETATDSLFLGENLFFVVIDVSVIKISSDSTIIWVAASGHPPVPFEKTWNDPPGRGPFKQVFALIEDTGDQQPTFEGLPELWGQPLRQPNDLPIDRQIADLRNVIFALNSVRSKYGDAQINAALAPLHEKITELERRLNSDDS